MGLSIHYKGRIKAKEMLPLLIDEIKNIAEVHNWSYHIFDEEFTGSTFGKKKFDESICGIVFTPPECETVSFTFLSNGSLCFPAALKYYLETKDKSLLYGVSVKTQFAGSSIHKLIVHMFDYLSKKYFEDFEFIDEGNYWENRNEKELDEKFEYLNKLIERVGGIIKTVKMSEGQSIDDYFNELIRKLKAQNLND